jgi:ABC-type dipeptide/oligopeptide/nickel transport system ATPase component
MSALLEVQGLCVDAGGRRAGRRVVQDAALTVSAGECVGVVGESGSGKSMTMRAIIGLLPRGARVAAGDLRFASDGGDPAPYDAVQVRGRGIAMVFQEPMTALNPTRRVGDLVADAIIVNGPGRVRRSAARRSAVTLLEEVGVPDPTGRARAFPHELSGGLRQRVMIAVALAGDPRLVICDEPTTALDVTVQDQILGLLDRLRRERGLGLLFVTHDLGVVAQISQRLVVMQDGQVVESGATVDVLDRPQHPYTAALRRAAAELEGAPDVKTAEVR